LDKQGRQRRQVLGAEVTDGSKIRSLVRGQHAKCHILFQFPGHLA
jgi:hypothetical protein